MKMLAFVFLLTLHVFQIQGIEDIWYRNNNVRCEKCDRGQKVTVHCSKDLQKSECVPCEEDTFADRLSFSKLCEKCTDCSHNDQIIKKNCTRERNTECKCPDKKYYDLGYCRSCAPPKIKRVRDETEFCEDCEPGNYYNNTLEDCVKCDICTRGQETWHACNVTHNTQCRQLPTTTDKHEDTLSGGEIAGIVIGVIIIVSIIIIIIIFIVGLKKNCCYKEAHKKWSSKPKWMTTTRKILIDNLDQIDLFVGDLGTPEFNATAKWEQLNDRKIETRLFKFMNLWYEQTKYPSLDQIIKTLQDLNRNDIVNIIKKDVKLKEQLSTEHKQNEDHDVPCDIKYKNEEAENETNTLLKSPQSRETTF